MKKILALVLFVALSAQATLVEGVLRDINLQLLTTKITFTPTNNVVVFPSYLNAGPATTITATNGVFATDLTVGQYWVSFPFIPSKRPFTICVPDTNIISIVETICDPRTALLYTNLVYLYTNTPTIELIAGGNISIVTNLANQVWTIIDSGGGGGTATATNIILIAGTNTVVQTNGTGIWTINSSLPGYLPAISVGNGINITNLSAPLMPLITNRVDNYGAKGDGRVLTDVSATSGSAVITSASAGFSASDIGKSVTLYMGTYTPKTATLSSGVATMTVANTNGLVVGFGVGGYGVPTNTTISAIANSTTMTLSKNATATATSELYGFYPGWLVTTISSVQSGTQVTLANNSTITTTGLRMVYGTDNTTAIQNAINASATSGGIVQFGKGMYVVAGALLNSSQQNSVLTLPNNSTLTQVTPIQFKGLGPAARGQSGYNGVASPMGGTILFCPTKANGTLPAMISGNGPAGGTSRLVFHCQDITLRSPNNPVLSMVNVRYCGGLSMQGVLCDTDNALEANERLTTLNTPAVVGPDFDSAAIFQITECEFNNWGAGVATDVHSVITRCQFGVCRKGISMYGPDARVYASHFVSCERDICNDSGGVSRLWGDAEVEDGAPGVGAIVNTGTFSEHGDLGSGNLQGWFLINKEGSATTIPVNFTSTSLHVVVADFSASTTTLWNPLNVSQKSFADMFYQARVAGDTAGFTTRNSSGTTTGLLVSDENVNQLILQSQSGYQLNLSTAVGAMTIGASDGIVTCVQGIASTKNATAAPTTISVTGSPFTYLNNSGQNQTIFFDANGATCSLTMNGSAIFTSTTGVRTTIPMQSGSTIVVTYSVATPVMKSMAQ